MTRKSKPATVRSLRVWVFVGRRRGDDLVGATVVPMTQASAKTLDGLRPGGLRKATLTLDPEPAR